MSSIQLDSTKSCTLPQPNTISERVFVVTGAFSGFGLALSLRLLINGDRVALIDVSNTPLETAEVNFNDIQRWINDNNKALKLSHVDVADFSALETSFLQVLDEFGHIDGVINNAGVSEGETIFNNTQNTSLKQDADSWKRTIDINLLGVIYGTALSLRYASRGASIINVASMAGLIPFSLVPIYSVSKFGVVALTQCCSNVFKQRKMRVNVICPGFAMTRLVRMLTQSFSEHEAFVSSDNVVDTKVKDVIDAMVSLLEPDDTRHGRVILVNKRGAVDWQFVQERAYAKKMKARL